MKVLTRGRAIRTSKVMPGQWGALPIQGEMCFGLTVEAAEAGDPPEFAALSQSHPTVGIPGVVAPQLFFNKTLFVFDDAVAVPSIDDLRFDSIPDVGGLVFAGDELAVVILGSNGLRSMSLASGRAVKSSGFRDRHPLWYGSWSVHVPLADGSTKVLLEVRAPTA